MRQLFFAFITTIGLMACVQAETMQEQENGVNQLHHKNFIGQRPYAKAPAAKPEADEKWVGAGIVTDKPASGFDRHQQMRLNFIGKRPYTAGTPAD